MNRIFIDMDGVIVDFESRMIELGFSGDELKKIPGAYLQMRPMPGAIEAVRSLIGMGFECWAATKPPTGIAYAYSDKAAWIFEHLPELKRKIIVTHDKGLLGDSGDFLIDDRPHKANCENFKGTLIVFGNGTGWSHVLEQIRATRASEESLPTIEEMSGFLAPDQVPDLRWKEKRIEQLEKALRRLLPIARACKQETFADVTGKEDTRSEAIAFAIATLREGP